MGQDKKIAEIQASTQRDTTRWTLAAQSKQTSMSLDMEKEMLQMQLEDAEKGRQSELQIALLAQEGALQTQKMIQETAFGQQATDLKIAELDKSDDAALVKAEGYGLKEARKTLESMMDWDSEGSNQTTSYYYGYSGSDSGNSSLDARIQAFFDQAAQSYTDFSNTMNEAGSDTTV